MADVWLGPAGSEVLLPKIRFIGSAPSWPISSDKQLEEATMSDGSKRFAFFKIKRVWGIGLGYLDKDQLDAMTLLNSYNQILRLQNNNEDATWYDVVIASFSHEPVRIDLRGMERYRVEMTLREA